ncbi:MAG: DNA repair protein RecN [Paludibacteraceae bacterium]|nr:DNA repair protein RecN [Paludibacteraceae bacterium]
MLKSLSVENYALIEKTNVEWNQGFSVITGETGSGKSILLGALGLVQGQRADSKALKDEEKKCVVEAEFDISAYTLSSFFEENDIDYDDNCIIRREIAPNGKSRAFVNDTPVALTLLKELTAKLIDIHSQHETLLLNEASFQLQVLDALSETSDPLTAYRTLFKEYSKKKRELKELIALNDERNANRDYLEFQLRQLQEAKFSENEQTDLEEEVNALSHTTELKEALSKSMWLLSEKEENICSALKEATNAIASIEGFSESYSEVKERLNSCLIELKDITREVEMKLSDVNVDPQRLEQANERLDLIYTLEKKHHVDNLADLLNLQADFEKQLSEMENAQEATEAIEKEIALLKDKLTKLAKQISEKRQKAKPKLEQSIAEILRGLGMPNAKLEVCVEPLPELDGNGGDAVKFLFSANKNASLQPISSVASGGELSRVMLALKSILCQSEELPTIILDEIDTGVSGEVADKMGDLMQKMGEQMQVISITHLPQIAAQGATHYKVYKEDNELTTLSHIKQLNETERVTEIAQMLSGSALSEAAIQNAKELLKR